MLSKIWTKLHTRKWQLIILGAVLTITTIASRVISVEYWSSLDFDVTGYSPWVAPIGILSMVIYLLILKMRKIKAPSLWIMGIIGLGYSVIMFWMVNL